MKDLLKKFTLLVEVKKIIAIIMTIVFCILALRKDVPVEQTMTIITMIITYYFSQSVEKERRKE